MLILVETPVGYTLWNVKDKRILDKDDLCEEYQTPDQVQSVLQLKSLSKFANAEEAISSLKSTCNAELSQPLQKFLEENVISNGIKDSIQVADAGLARAISSLGIKCISPQGKDIPEIFRLIKNNIPSLLPGIDDATYRQLELGVAHGISTEVLKFSPSKVDSMIVNSVNLLDELDKEVNNYGMRVREWYGWHFPELKNVTADNYLFAQIVLKMGRRENAQTTDLEELKLTPQNVEEIRKSAQISIGTELSDDDLQCIQALATQVIELIEFKNQISNYIKQRMKEIAPNLTDLVGDSVGARLIAHAGSLNQLAKQAGSTIQVFGAEKALFKAKKEGKDTPKYGLLYHAQLVAHADQKFKGRMARSLAAKTALSSRKDAYGDEASKEIGSDDLLRLEKRLRQMQGQNDISFDKSRSFIKEEAEPQKIVVEQTPNYKPDTDFQIEELPKKRRKKKHHHKEGENGTETPAENVEGVAAE
ncbi:Nucleolar protein 58 [Tritrichomonas musculus]|uniref:Nucleolar protein 58 n=1 Tax=Tritrichomonas musculus TaxID=1915356 RepID=A0ABR2I6U3_9EUKA